MKRIAEVINNVITTVIIFVSIFLLAISITPRALGYTVCGLGDKSMEPTYKKGSFIIAEPIDFEKIEVGDALVFVNPGTRACFTRRVKEIWPDKKQFVTSADASKEPDPMTTAYSCVAGKVLYRIPYLGYFPVFMNTIYGKLALAILYIGWVSIEMELSRSRANKRRTKES